MTAKAIPGFDRLASGWEARAPLGWDSGDPKPVARAAAFLLSDWASGISGEILHVDGGYHAMRADLIKEPAAAESESPTRGGAL